MNESKLSEIYYVSVIGGGNTGAIYSLGVVVKRKGSRSKRLLMSGVRQLIKFSEDLEVMEFELNSMKDPE